MVVTKTDRELKPTTNFALAAILFYLAKRFPDSALLPDEFEAQAQVISWMSFVASTVHPARRQGPEAARAVSLVFWYARAM